MNHITFHSDTSEQDPRSVWKQRNAPINITTFEHVIIKVNDLEAWKRLHLTYGTISSPKPGEWIVTADIPSDRLFYIRQQPFVLAIEAGRPIGPNAPSVSCSETGQKASK